MPIYLSIVVLGSVVAHLVSEFFAMGAAANAVALSPTHLYLGVAVLVAAAVAAQQALALWRNSRGGRDLKSALHVGLETLPFRGRGAFLIFTAGLQLGISMTTEIGEGCPFCGHDVFAGVVGAVATIALLAFAARTIGRRLPTIAAAISALLIAPARNADALVVSRSASALPAPRFVWFDKLYNRPPPSLSLA
jgi:heme exporter protein D